MEFVVAIVHSDGWLSPKHNQQLLAAVMKVVDELRRAGLELPDGTAQRTGWRSNQTSGAETTPVGHIVPDIPRVAAHGRASILGRAQARAMGVGNERVIYLGNGFLRWKRWL